MLGNMAFRLNQYLLFSFRLIMILGLAAYFSPTVAHAMHAHHHEAAISAAGVAIAGTVHSDGDVDHGAAAKHKSGCPHGCCGASCVASAIVAPFVALAGVKTSAVAFAGNDRNAPSQQYRLNRPPRTIA
jgi:hypothetical protein